MAFFFFYQNSPPPILLFWTQTICLRHGLMQLPWNSDGGISRRHAWCWYLKSPMMCILKGFGTVASVAFEHSRKGYLILINYLDFTLDSTKALRWQSRQQHLRFRSGSRQSASLSHRRCLCRHWRRWEWSFWLEFHLWFRPVRCYDYRCRWNY